MARIDLFNLGSLTSRAPMTKSLKLNLLTFILGLGVFIWLLYSIQVSTIWPLIAQAGYLVFPIILGYGVVQLFFVSAWRVLLNTDGRRIGLWELVRIHLAGYAVNYMMLSGNVAGEPLKAHLLRDKLPMVEGLTSVTVNKLSEGASMTIFQAIGLAVAFAYHLLTPEMAWGSLLSFTVLTIAMGLFFWRQKKGLFGWFFQGLGKAGIDGPYLSKVTYQAERLDTAIADFYKSGSHRFAASLFLNFLGSVGGAIEGYFFLKLLGIDATLPMIITLEAISILANNIFFFVPARMGGSDAARVLVFVSMGLTSAQGFSYGLLRRAREIFYVLLGFIFLFRMNPFRERSSETMADQPPVGPSTKHSAL